MGQAAVNTPASKSAARFNLSYSSILLLDESVHGLDLMAQILAGFGARSFHKTQTVEDAQKIAESRPFDLCIVDPDLSDRSGYDFIRWLRQSNLQPQCHAPVIVATGHAPLENVRRARDVGANVVIRKPLKSNLLLERILWVAREQRSFVQTSSYIGPDRRFQNLGPPGATEGRRKGDLKGSVKETADPNMLQSEIDLLLKPQRAKIDGL